MSEIVRVKPQKHYNWHQTTTNVTLNINIPNTTLNKLSVEVFDVLLIVSNKQSKSNPHVFDLEKPISKINTKYFNGVLEIVMLKKEESTWDDLVVHLPIADMRKRRQEARSRKDVVAREIEEKKSKLADEYDRKATQQLMKLEQQQRNKLQEKKRKQKSQAQQNIFKDIDANGNIKKSEKTNEDWQNKQKIALQILQKQEQQQKKQKYLQIQQRKKKNNAIFSSEQVQQSQVQAIKFQQQFQQIPIRKAQNIKLKLTQKPFPHVAVRQTHFQQAPMPKTNKQNIKGNENQSLEQRNPIWLKDKGDKLVKNKDYLSAINAYNQSLKLNNDLISAQMNRSYCNMKLFNFDECIADCQLILRKLQISKQQKTQDKIIKIKCRLAMCLGWKGKIEDSKKQFQSILEQFNLSQTLKQQVNNSLQLLTFRSSSITIKQKGDQFFKLKDYQSASKFYNQSIINDNNEYSIANNALVQLKLGNYQKCIEECNKAEKILLSFTSNLSSAGQQSRSQTISLLSKIYLRKGTAFKQLKNYSQALSTLRALKFIDDKQVNCQNLIKQIEHTINKQKYSQLKLSADNFVRSNNLIEALSKYKQCLGLLTSSELVQYLSVLLNQCVCHLKLQNYNEIVSICIRGLKLSNSTMGVDYHLNKQQKQKIYQFKVRFLVRKAKAYLSLKQFYNAESDVKDALKVEISNQRIKNELEELRKQIANK